MHANRLEQKTEATGATHMKDKGPRAEVAWDAEVKKAENCSKNQVISALLYLCVLRDLCAGLLFYCPAPGHWSLNWLRFSWS